MIFDMTKRADGGGGLLKLLASGTYTTGSSITNLSIPVTYSGTVMYAVACAVDPPTGTAQTIYDVCCFVPITSDLSTYYDGKHELWLAMSASNAYSFSVRSAGNLGQSYVTATTLRLGRPSPSSPWLPNQKYNWYLYGV